MAENRSTSYTYTDTMQSVRSVTLKALSPLIMEAIMDLKKKGNENCEEEEEISIPELRIPSPVPCYICDITVPSSSVMGAHLAGVKHQRRLKDLRVRQLSIYSDQHIVFEKHEFRCTLCNALMNCASQVDAHLGGMKHRRKLGLDVGEDNKKKKKEKKKAEKSTSTTTTTATSAIIPTSTAAAGRGENKKREGVMFDGTPVVVNVVTNSGGLVCGTPTEIPPRKVRPQYRCYGCDIVFRAEFQLEQHLTSEGHKDGTANPMKYKRKLERKLQRYEKKRQRFLKLHRVREETNKQLAAPSAWETLTSTTTSAIFPKSTSAAQSNQKKHNRKLKKKQIEFQDGGQLGSSVPTSSSEYETTDGASEQMCYSNVFSTHQPPPFIPPFTGREAPFQPQQQQHMCCCYSPCNCAYASNHPFFGYNYSATTTTTTATAISNKSSYSSDQFGFRSPSPPPLPSLPPPPLPPPPPPPPLTPPPLFY